MKDHVVWTISCWSASGACHEASATHDEGSVDWIYHSIMVAVTRAPSTVGSFPTKQGVRKLVALVPIESDKPSVP